MQVDGSRARDATRASAIDTTLEKLGGLKALFAADGIRDRGQLVVDQRRRLRLCSSAGRACSTPSRWPASPAAQRSATTPTCSASLRSRPRTARSRGPGKTWADVDVVELNEAFASQSLACLQLWPELDPEKVNIHGGAIAIGHPLGASGGRIIGHAAHELARRGGGVAVAAICIGVGQGLAVVLER